MEGIEVKSLSSSSITIDGTSFEVEGSPYTDVHYFRDGKQVFAAFLALDVGAENPLEAGDGNGSIFEGRRHHPTLGDMAKALGMDRDGYRDFANANVVRLSAEMAIDALMNDRQFVDMAKGSFELDDESAVRAKVWDDYLDPETYHRSWLERDFPATKVNENTFDDAAWEKARIDGLVGNPFAVSLDVYQHGLVMYSVSGEGPSCQFDTARGGAVWIPDASLERDLWEIALAQFKVKIVEKHSRYAWVTSDNGTDNAGGSKKQYSQVEPAVFTVFIDDAKGAEFATFTEAKDNAIGALGAGYDAAKAIAATRDKAREYAAQAAVDYTNWSNGECYRLVIEEWKLVSDEDGDVLAKFIESEIVGDCVGYESAMSELLSSLKNRLPVALEAQ